MRMPKKSTQRRVTINLPSDLLKDAQKAAAQPSITETIIEGLSILRQRNAVAMAQKLIGKVHLDIDLKVSRERNY